ncbi:MAG: hypothetical protein M5R36_08185 [Deltaproteobacteria bacterium]|nr:hypothetical protein [Deltaproteobacteria bacterium]
MTKKALIPAILALLAITVAIPASAANTGDGFYENIATVAVDRAGVSMVDATDLFLTRLVGSNYHPARMNGEEELTIHGRTMTTSQWYTLAYRLYEESWDDLVDGSYRRSMILANRANAIFTKLLQEGR